jgi:hypothetical protein
MAVLMFDHLFETIQYFARGGGGGSGGGGAEVFGIIGYFPSYYLGKLVKKIFPRKLELIISMSCAAVFSVLLIIILPFVVKSSSVTFLLLATGVGIWAGWYAAFFSIVDRMKAKNKKIQPLLQQAAQLDTHWNSDFLKNTATTLFLNYQKDWSAFNLAHITTYTTPNQARHTALMLRILQEMYRTNSMSEVEIMNLIIVDVHDDPDNQKDTYQVMFQAKATDVLVDTRTQTTLFSDKRPFVEFWNFTRNGDLWLLDSITQQTASVQTADLTIKQFAAANGMYYSVDMGWLFLPNTGILFKGGVFGKSDINNHVVGVYNTHLMQLYSYIPITGFVIIVAQINLPKSYEGIIIQPKASFWSARSTPKVPSNYQKYTFEWPDFNKRYTVHATSQDRLATFELLNPGFMAYLYDADAQVSIEVADNVVYLYRSVNTKASAGTSKDYEKMFTILSKAFKELRL